MHAVAVPGDGLLALDSQQAPLADLGRVKVLRRSTGAGRPQAFVRSTRPGRPSRAALLEKTRPAPLALSVCCHPVEAQGERTTDIAFIRDREMS